MLFESGVEGFGRCVGGLGFGYYVDYLCYGVVFDGGVCVYG